MYPSQSPKTGLIVSGQFADICGVNKQTLLYYDKIGLFSPCLKDKNGFRYYAPEQVDTFHTILALREIMPLSELKQYIQIRDKAHFQAVFERGVEKLTQQISRLEYERAMMLRKLDLVQEAVNAEESIIYPRYCPKESLKLSPDVCALQPGRGEPSAMGSIVQYRVEHNLSLGRGIGGILPSSWLESGKPNGTHCRWYYSELAPESPREEGFIKAAGNYMVYYHVGDYHTTYQVFPKLLDYARQNGFDIGEYIYEEPLADEIVEVDPSRYVTRISVPFTVTRGSPPG